MLHGHLNTFLKYMLDWIFFFTFLITCKLKQWIDTNVTEFLYLFLLVKNLSLQPLFLPGPEAVWCHHGGSSLWHHLWQNPTWERWHYCRGEDMPHKYTIYTLNHSFFDIILSGRGVLLVSQDWPFEDGAPPPSKLVDDWLSLLKKKFQEDPGCCVAVHCVAGLGR